MFILQSGTVRIKQKLGGGKEVRTGLIPENVTLVEHEQENWGLTKPVKQLKFDDEEQCKKSRDYKKRPYLPILQL